MLAVIGETSLVNSTKKDAHSKKKCQKKISKENNYFHILQAQLHEMQVKVGDLEKGMEDVIQSLEKAMTELNLMDIATGDPKYLETLIKKLNVNNPVNC